MATQTKSERLNSTVNIIVEDSMVPAARQHVTKVEFFVHVSVEFFQFRTEPQFCKKKTN